MTPLRNEMWLTWRRTRWIGLGCGAAHLALGLTILITGAEIRGIHDDAVQALQRFGGFAVACMLFLAAWIDHLTGGGRTLDRSRPVRARDELLGRFGVVGMVYVLAMTLPMGLLSVFHAATPYALAPWLPEMSGVLVAWQIVAFVGAAGVIPALASRLRLAYRLAWPLAGFLMVAGVDSATRSFPPTIVLIAGAAILLGMTIVAGRVAGRGGLHGRRLDQRWPDATVAAVCVFPIGFFGFLMIDEVADGFRRGSEHPRVTNPVEYNLVPELGVVRVRRDTNNGVIETDPIGPSSGIPTGEPEVHRARFTGYRYLTGALTLYPRPAAQHRRPWWDLPRFYELQRNASEIQAIHVLAEDRVYIGYRDTVVRRDRVDPRPPLTPAWLHRFAFDITGPASFETLSDLARLGPRTAIPFADPTSVTFFDAEPARVLRIPASEPFTQAATFVFDPQAAPGSVSGTAAIAGSENIDLVAYSNGQSRRITTAPMPDGRPWLIRLAPLDTRWMLLSEHPHPDGVRHRFQMSDEGGQWSDPKPLPPLHPVQPLPDTGPGQSPIHEQLLPSWLPPLFTGSPKPEPLRLAVFGPWVIPATALAILTGSLIAGLLAPRRGFGRIPAAVAGGLLGPAFGLGLLLFPRVPGVAEREALFAEP